MKLRSMMLAIAITIATSLCLSSEAMAAQQNKGKRKIRPVPNPSTRQSSSTGPSTPVGTPVLQAPDVIAEEYKKELLTTCGNGKSYALFGDDIQRGALLEVVNPRWEIMDDKSVSRRFGDHLDEINDTLYLLKSRPNLLPSGGTLWSGELVMYAAGYRVRSSRRTYWRHESASDIPQWQSYKESNAIPVLRLPIAFLYDANNTLARSRGDERWQISDSNTKPAFDGDLTPPLPSRNKRALSCEAVLRTVNGQR